MLAVLVLMARHCVQLVSTTCTARRTRAVLRGATVGRRVAAVEVRVVIVDVAVVLAVVAGYGVELVSAACAADCT